MSYPWGLAASYIFFFWNNEDEADRTDRLCPRHYDMGHDVSSSRTLRARVIELANYYLTDYLTGHRCVFEDLHVSDLRSYCGHARGTEHHQRQKR